MIGLEKGRDDGEEGGKVKVHKAGSRRIRVIGILLERGAQFVISAALLKGNSAAAAPDVINGLTCYKISGKD